MDDFVRAKKHTSTSFFASVRQQRSAADAWWQHGSLSDFPTLLCASGVSERGVSRYVCLRMKFLRSVLVARGSACSWRPDCVQAMCIV